MATKFPLSGVAGLIAECPEELDRARQLQLTTVEIRADLLLANGLSETDVMDTVRRSRAQGLACLFTLRHPSHGGKFEGPEGERVRISRMALDAGAQVVDLEWELPASRELLAGGAPVLLSHHDFSNMLAPEGLQRISDEMEAAGPLAVKIVPCGSTLSDALTMLQWVAGAASDGPHRIGFTMGAEGACSRILSIAYGAPITYASFGEAKAPGQLPIREMLDIYRVHALNPQTRVYGIAGNAALASFSPFLHNPSFQTRGINSVYVPLQTQSFADLMAAADGLRIDGMSVTNPYKADALEAADEVDARSRSCGASNTLLIERYSGGRRIKAFNTDFDGVTIPIARHRELLGSETAVVGNGGAARGAVVALADARADVTLFYRNAERGEPVARELGVSGKLLEEIDATYDVVINATTLGAKAGDPSPVPAGVFERADQVAFDMCYQQPSSTFLDDAVRGGAALVRGGEMLVAQGTVQFTHFTGEVVSLDEFEANFAAASGYR